MAIPPGLVDLLKVFILGLLYAGVLCCILIALTRPDRRG